MHQLDPYAYFRAVLTHAPNAKSKAELIALLPFNIDKRLLDS